MYEFTGKVKTVGELQTFASGFTKRELVVEEEREGNWPNVVAFAFKKDNVAKLDGVKPSVRVKVGLAVDGRCFERCEVATHCQISPRAASMGQRKECPVKCVFFAVLMAALCGCAQRDRLVLSTGEPVETLYYHECRMPDEVMTEMWIDFASRRLRLKCGLHDALGWTSSRCDSIRLEVCLKEGDWRAVVRNLQLAGLEAWPDCMSAGVDAGTSSWYLRMTSGGNSVEKFKLREMPHGAEYMREIVCRAAAWGGGS